MGREKTHMTLETDGVETERGRTERERGLVGRHFAWVWAQLSVVET